MASYIIRRLLLIIPALLGVSLLVFSMVRLVPGDPAIFIAGEHASEEDIHAIREKFGLTRSLPIQYAIFLGNLLRGDLGRSTRTDRPVAVEIWERFPDTLQLAGASMLIASVFGLAAGVISATRRYTIVDYTAMVGAMIGVSAPVFWLGLMLMLLFSVRLNWLPAVGSGTVYHLIFPAITLGAASTAVIARMTRSSMLEVFGQDYVRTARSKGLREDRVITKYALRNSLVPVITIMGLRFGTLLGGAVLTETVFAWPGVGRLMVDSILARDYPVVQGAVLVVAMTFIFVNLAVDLLYSFIDPRIRCE